VSRSAEPDADDDPSELADSRLTHPSSLHVTITSLADGEMNSTTFPTLPGDVAVLTPSELAFDLEWNSVPSLDEVCRRFGNDVNRALVWLIRVRALKAWCARDRSAEWLSPRRMPHVCEVAARFELNDECEFDADAFRLAVEMIADQRSQREGR
jgi:hypothetical protein